ncbi:MAG: sugar ABC transporter permease YjfF [Cellulomonas sp.]|uniref:ABC transporter permease n=1 Tax=Cellulomonas gelida TaxID=1712 RepID=A0A4Y3KS33_9CELL|nr:MULTISPECIES: ABC transporter permease [Cellulomonas]KMM45536.1 ABC transporter permease [Cellulomonas sp. A375-1]MCR6648422.1 sugar ABC transporter permease YjfF [Cellulomonas sp.]MCR6704371.1 sugar ABC transporter permease YjfF [Cellulomonas sp.]GEA85995.1 ABC transporter permease [Cellulomonas gelida]GGL31493.1 ABC transporter permease [Cellulomonas gelida]
MTAQSVSEKLPTKRTPSDHSTQWWRRLLDRRYLPTIGTVATLILLLVIGQLRYSTDDRSFISARLFSNLFIDNSYLLVLAIGMTFVIISGGIDLSVGGVVALTGLVVAKLLENGAPLPFVLVVGVLVGTAIGSLIGVMVQYFKIQPFIASLAGLFLARGLANLIGTTAIGIKDEGFASLASWKIKFGEKPDIWYVNLSMIIALVVLLAAVYLLHYTRFGRTVYGLGAGDNGQAAGLMGLRPGATKMWVYVISGTCAGIGGILFALYTKSGYNLSGVGMELDAIASVVIGGALLTGGVGYVLGTFAGVTVYGLILVICNREGLEIWWNRILIGAILLGFVLLQRVLVAKRR